MARVLRALIFGFEILTINAASPVFSPTTYNIQVGLNTTAGTILTTLSASDSDNDTLTYAISNTNGSIYFDVDTSTGSPNLVLVNLLDVEYGNIQWSFEVTATDGANIATATISVATYQSTTTSTTTVAPPGYDWFAETNNIILFASVMGFTALMTGVCVLMCWKFHRDGTCLPEMCPTYKQCRKSASRTCNCPIPCNYYQKKKKKKRKAKKKAAKIKKLSEPPTPQPKVVQENEKEKKGDTKTSKVVKPSKKPPEKNGDTRVSDGSVTPLSIGNVSLHDVGMDRARTPGFNAPAVTAYGGKRSISPKLFKKR